MSSYKIKNFKYDLKILLDWSDYDVMKLTGGRDTIDFNDIATWYKKERKLSTSEAKLLTEKLLFGLKEFEKCMPSHDEIENTIITHNAFPKQNPSSVIERAIDYQLSSWWPVLERALFFQIKTGNCKSAAKNERIMCSLREKKTLMAITKNKTEDIFIYFIDKSINNNGNGNFDENQLEINKGLGILIDYWGGRGRSKMRQNKLAKKYCVSEAYVSQVIRKAKRQLKKTLFEAVDKNLITIKQEKIFLLCYIDNLNHSQISNKLNISRGFVSRSIRLVKWILYEIAQKEVPKRYSNRRREFIRSRYM